MLVTLSTYFSVMNLDAALIGVELGRTRSDDFHKIFIKPRARLGMSHRL